MSEELSTNEYRQQRIQNMIQQARQQEVPVEPLMNKVHEGIAKKVDAGDDGDGNG